MSNDEWLVISSFAIRHLYRRLPAPVHALPCAFCDTPGVRPRRTSAPDHVGTVCPGLQALQVRGKFPRRTDAHRQ